MISVLIIAIMLMAIASATGFAIINLTSSTTDYANNQSDAAQLDKWQSVISNSLRPFGNNQDLLAPIGVNATDDDGDGFPDKPFMSLPDLDGSIGFSKFNSKGYELIYCPLMQNAALSAFGTDDSVTSDNDPSAINKYNVKKVPFDNNAFYVNYSEAVFPHYNSAGDTSINDVLAIIISPLTKDIPKCEDLRPDHSIRDTESNLPIAGVRLILKNEVLAKAVNKPLHIVDSGETSMQSFLSRYEAIQPSRFIVDLLTEKSYSVMEDTSVSSMSSTIKSSFPGQSSQVLIRGNGATITSANSNGMVFNGIDLYLENVSFDSNVNLKLINSRLTVGPNVNFGILTLEGSSVLNDGNLLQASVINAKGAKIEFLNSSLKAGSINLTGSNFQMFDSGLLELSNTLNLQKNSSVMIDNTANFNATASNTNGLISIDESSSFTLSSTTLESVSSSTDSILIYSKGYVNIYNNSNVYMNQLYKHLIEIDSGSKLTIENSFIGDAGVQITTGGSVIRVNGYAFVSGGNTEIRAPTGFNCWNTSETVFSSASGNNSYPDNSNENLRLINQSNWNCERDNVAP